MDNSFVVVQRRIEFFYYFSFHAFGDFIFLGAQKNEAKKGRPQTPGGLHSAKRFCGNTPCSGLHSWDAIKMSAAKRTHALCTLIAY